MTFKADALGTAGVGSTVQVGTETSNSQLQSVDGLDRPVSIPLGDINGDSYDDFIGFVQESGPTPWLAKVFFGGANVTTPAFQTPDLQIQLPFDYSGLSIAGTVINNVFATGDFNADGFGDFAVVDDFVP